MAIGNWQMVFFEFFVVWEDPEECFSSHYFLEHIYTYTKRINCLFTAIYQANVPQSLNGSDFYLCALGPCLGV